MKARNARADIYIGGKNLTEVFQKNLLSIKYSDTLEGESDTVEMELDDANHRLLQNYAPQRGTEADIKLVKCNWNSKQFYENEPELSLPLGAFELDEVSYSMPPSKYVLKFNSVFHKMQIKRVEKYRTWEQTTLKKVAGDIAADAGLKLFYERGENAREFSRGKNRRTL